MICKILTILKNLVCLQFRHISEWISSRFLSLDIYSCMALEIRHKGNLLFCGMGPTNSNFWQIKRIIRLTSHINIFIFTIWFSPNMIFFFWAAIKSIKNKTLVHVTLLNHSIKRCGCILKHKFLHLED